MTRNCIWYLPATFLLGCSPAMAPLSVDASHPASPDAQEASLPEASEVLRPPPSGEVSEDGPAPAQHMHHSSGHMNMPGMDMTGAGMNANKHEMK